MLVAGGQREAFSFVKRDYEDTRAEGRWRRGSIRFRGGCETSATALETDIMWSIPMPLGSLESTSVVALLAELAGLSFVIVEVEELLLKVLARGARCVSLSFLVSFQVEEAIFYGDAQGVDWAGGVRAMWAAVLPVLGRRSAAAAVPRRGAVGYRSVCREGLEEGEDGRQEAELVGLP